MSGIVREEHDFDAAIRQALQRLRAEKGDGEKELSENQLAKEIGLKQSTVNRHLKKAKTWSGALISTICNTLELSPIELLSLSDAYKLDAIPWTRPRKDSLYDRLKLALLRIELQALVGDVEEAKRLGVYEEAAAAFSNVLRASRQARRAVEESEDETSMQS